ncbi:MAG: glycosyltransferase family 9 protein [Endomicrobiales bacterium]
MESAKRDRILIVNLGGAGDLVLSSAALRLLREKYKTARMDILAAERCRELAQAYGFFDHVYPFPWKLPAALKLLGTLRRVRYDITANMRTIVGWRGAVKMYALLKFIGGRVWAGRNTDRRGFFFDLKVPETYRAEKREFEYDLDMARLLGAEAGAVRIHVPFSSGDLAYVESLFREKNISPADCVIGINPGGQPSRRWPRENFAELIRLLLRSLPCKIILTGSGGEKELGASLRTAAGVERVLDLSGATTIPKLSLAAGKCRFFISNDTGTMHVCVSAGTPGVFLFGGGNLTRFAPFKNPGNYVLLKKQVPCSPCEKYSCREMTCMKGISVPEVFDAVSGAMARPHA